MSGLTNLIGEPDGPPMSPGYPLGDLIAGIFGSLSVMMALYHRDLRGGEGQMIDLALYEAVFRFLDFDPIQYDQMKIVHKRTGNRVAYVAPSSMFKTKDGKYLTLAASTQSVWLRLAEAIGRKDMTTDPKFIDNSARVSIVLGARTAMIAPSIVEATKISATGRCGRECLQSRLLVGLGSGRDEPCTWNRLAPGQAKRLSMTAKSAVNRVPGSCDYDIIAGVAAGLWQGMAMSGTLMRAVFAAVFAVAVQLALAGSATAAKRVALVIGNDQYSNIPQLRKAVNDARTMNDTLRKLGFTVLVAENQNRKGLSETMLAFDRMIEKGDTAFFFFAGHGFEIGGENYLLPTDVPSATVGQEELIRDGAIAAERIITRIQNRGAATAIFVLDACRNNPFERAGTRALSGSGGLAAMTPPEGVFVIYSAGAKQTALDRLSNDDSNPNSVFTRNFSKTLGEPGLNLVQIAKRTQSEVRDLAQGIRHVQTPAYYDQIVGDVVLTPADRTARSTS